MIVTGPITVLRRSDGTRRRYDSRPMPPKPRSGKPKAKTPPAGHPARGRSWIVIAAGAALGVIVVALGLVLLGGGNGGSAGDARVALEQAGCTLTVVKALDNKSDHSDVPTPETKVEWNTDPPTNGPHFGVPAIFGAYDAPLEQTRVVHNLEHGGVYIQYGSDVPQATVEKLRAFYDDHQNGTLLAPLPELGTTIALGAWVAPDGGYRRGQGYLAKCEDFDQAAFAAFFDAYQFKGPERFPPNTLAPGS
jgi:Protein of unknown function (DUF3105)